MQPGILTIGVTFPAIPLMTANFGNRYTVLATSINNKLINPICEVDALFWDE